MGARVSHGAVLYQLIRVMAWIVTCLVCRCSVSGRKQVPTSGPLLIVANHLSWYDPLLLGVVLSRRAWFFTKVEMFRWPIVGWLCKRTAQIPVRRGAADRPALEKALRYLSEGKAIVFFPEGTVERQEQMMEAHPGVALLALRSGATVLPVALSGTRRILRRRRPGQCRRRRGQEARTQRPRRRAADRRGPRRRRRRTRRPACRTRWPAYRTRRPAWPPRVP